MLRMLVLAVALISAMAAAKDGSMQTATGEFQVTLTPLAAEIGGTQRLALTKRFDGALAGTSTGQMMSAGDPGKGQAGYVALEVVEASLGGRRGGFALQHSGTMAQGTPSLSVTVVPDSGTGELVGLAGTFNIIIADGKHSYEFDYTLP
jgi:hypothetical protein